MKRYFLFLLALNLFIPVIMAQTNSRFPIKSGSVWRINYENSCIDLPFNHVSGDEEYKYFIDGDTTIKTRKYFKLYKSGILFLDTPFRIEHKYMGAIRDSADKFFFMKENEDKEELLYDFSMKVNDSIYVKQYKSKIKVDEIDTMENGRKRYFFNMISVNCGSSNTILEGMGWFGGLLEGNSCLDHPGIRGSYVVCFSEDDEIIFETLHTRCRIEVVCNNEITDIKDSFEKLRPEIIVMPDKSVNIKFDSEYENLIDIEIIDISGKRLFMRKYAAEESIDIGPLNKGIFFVRLANKQQVYISRFIIY